MSWLPFLSHTRSIARLGDVVPAIYSNSVSLLFFAVRRSMNFCLFIILFGSNQCFMLSRSGLVLLSRLEHPLRVIFAHRCVVHSSERSLLSLRGARDHCSAFFFCAVLSFIPFCLCIRLTLVGSFDFIGINKNLYSFKILFLFVSASVGLCCSWLVFLFR